MTATHYTFTATDAKNTLAAAEGRWNEARLVQSDLPGVQYLSLDLGGIRIEVYASTREFGNATVIAGRAGHLVTPTQEMVDAFTAAGGRSIFETA